MVANEAAAAGKPRERALDNPPHWKNDEALGLVGALDDGEFPVTGGGNMGGADGSLIASIGEDDLDEGKHCSCLCIEDQGGAVAILNARMVNDDVQQQSERVNQDVVFDPFDLFPAILADRVRADPPFCAARTL